MRLPFERSDTRGELVAQAVIAGNAVVHDWIGCEGRVNSYI